MQRILHILQFLLARDIGPYFAMLGQEYVTPPLHGADDFRDFNVRYDRPVADLVHDAGGRFHVHCHGPLQSVLSDFIELGADVLHPIEAPPLGDVTAKEAKQTFRNRVCIEGNVQIGDMYTEDPDTIRSLTAELIHDAFGDGKGLIVCPTASPYVPEMSERCFENYAALVAVVTSWHNR